MHPSELFNPENAPDVTKLGFETPEAKQVFEFDPKKVFSPEDFEAMRAYVDHERSGRRWQEFVWTAADVQTLDASIHIPIQEQEWRGIEGGLQSNIDLGHSWDNIARIIAGLRRVDPSHEIPTDLQIQEIQSKLELRLANVRAFWLLREIVESAFTLHELDSGYTVDISSDEWKKLDAWLERLRSAGNWLEFCEQAARIRTIDPGHDLPWDETDQQHAFDGLQKTLKEETILWNWAARKAANLKIIADTERRPEEPTSTSLTSPLPEVTTF